MENNDPDVNQEVQSLEIDNDSPDGRTVKIGESESTSAEFGVLAVLVITFFNVSGGPWGSEEMFATLGPLYGILGIMIFAIAFSVPQCLMTIELICAFPTTNAGYCVWVREALGDFWAVQQCYWNWVSGIVDTAVYPVIICDTVVHLFGYEDVSNWSLWPWKLLLTFILSFPTIFPASNFPKVLHGLAVASLLPLLLFLSCAAAHLDLGVFSQVRSKADWEVVRKYMHAVFWNLEGWDCICACATLIQAPKERTLSRGLGFALFFVVCQYAITLSFAAGTEPHIHPWNTWADGSLASVAHAVYPWLGAVVLIAAAVGNAGLYLTEFFEDAFLLQGAADAGLAPRIFSWRWRDSSAPLPVAVLQVVLISCLVSFEFDDILIFDNFFTAIAVIFQFVAFVILRARQPDLHRPFRAPLPSFLIAGPPLVILTIIFGSCFTSLQAVVVNLIAFALGLPYGYWVVNRFRRDENGVSTLLDVFAE